MSTRNFDVLIIGSGAAGLTAALRLPEHLSIAVLSKGPIDAGSTAWAQGGIAAVLHLKDSFEQHVADTLDAGGGLCDEAAVRFVVENGPSAIDWLIEQGTSFDKRKSGDYHLTREGGHSMRRVIHSADATGAAVQTSLDERARARDNITLFEDHMAVDLILRDDRPDARCVGAYVLEIGSQEVLTMSARAVIIATGGASRAYNYTSNPDGSTGDGIAMAWRAGARVGNMEFNQFHPTCLYHREARTFLITEAVRGEGGKLRLPNGKRFMDKFDPRGELAPRDIVARAIDHEMKRLGLDCVYLDISHRKKKFIKKHFPTVRRICKQYGILMEDEPIPVVPAAHYTCGGIVTDLQGRTDVPGLYAIGECAHTGLHGANRMASNSLLECFVFATAAAKDIAARDAELAPAGTLPEWDESQVTDSDEEVVVSHNWEELRRAMWTYVGIVRTDKRLARAKHRVDLLAAEIGEYYRNFRVTRDLLELRNLVQVADLIVQCALWRRESRGLHYTTDCPDTLPAPEDSILTPQRRLRLLPANESAA